MLHLLPIELAYFILKDILNPTCLELVNLDTAFCNHRCRATVLRMLSRKNMLQHTDIWGKLRTTDTRISFLSWTTTRAVSPPELCIKPSELSDLTQALQVLPLCTAVTSMRFVHAIYPAAPADAGGRDLVAFLSHFPNLTKLGFDNWRLLTDDDFTTLTTLTCPITSLHLQDLPNLSINAVVAVLSRFSLNSISCTTSRSSEDMRDIAAACNTVKQFTLSVDHRSDIVGVLEAIAARLPCLETFAAPAKVWWPIAVSLDAVRHLSSFPMLQSIQCSQWEIAVPASVYLPLILTNCKLIKTVQFAKSSFHFSHDASNNKLIEMEVSTLNDLKALFEVLVSLKVSVSIIIVCGVDGALPKACGVDGALQKALLLQLTTSFGRTLRALVVCTDLANDIDANTMFDALSLCPNLTRLRLDDARNAFSEDTTVALVSVCPNIVDWEISHMALADTAMMRMLEALKSKATNPIERLVFCRCANLTSTSLIIAVKLFPWIKTIGITNGAKDNVVLKLIVSRKLHAEQVVVTSSDEPRVKDGLKRLRWKCAIPRIVNSGSLLVPLKPALK